MNKADFNIGDLVHIPQSVQLLDIHQWTPEDPQLAIPSRVMQTVGPTIGVVMHKSATAGYSRIFCDGDIWAVKNDSVYILKKED